LQLEYIDHKSEKGTFTQDPKILSQDRLLTPTQRFCEHGNSTQRIFVKENCSSGKKFPLATATLRSFFGAGSLVNFGMEVQSVSVSEARELLSHLPVFAFGPADPDVRLFSGGLLESSIVQDIWRELQIAWPQTNR
jgi:hypothetical protein